MGIPKHKPYRWLKRVECQLRATEGRAQTLVTYKTPVVAGSDKRKTFPETIELGHDHCALRVGLYLTMVFFSFFFRYKIAWLHGKIQMNTGIVRVYAYNNTYRYMILFELRKCKKKKCYNNKYFYSIGTFVAI